MGDEFGIMLGLLVLAYLFLTPFVLIILYTRQRRTLLWLEDELTILKQSFQEYRERMGSQPDSRQQADLEPQDTMPEARPTAAAEMQEMPGTLDDLPLTEPDEVPVKELEAVPEPHVEPTLSPEFETIDEVGGPSNQERMRAFLQEIGMWPPSREESMDRETVLMQWWLPRIGGLLALLSALFFGVYINQNTSPLFKCFELCGVSLGVTGLGWFMERKYRKFGGVLLATGLIMLYLTSVAAYALPATRVIASPVMGSIVQGAVLIAICAIAVMRDSRGLVLLVFHFAYFLGLFMVHEGLREGALIEAGLIYVAGTLLIRRELYRSLGWVIVAGSYLVVLAFPLLGIFKPIDLPLSVSVQAYISFVFAGIIMANYTGLLGTGRQARWLLSMGSSLAIASTLLFFRELYPDDLEWACLILGIVMLAGSLFGWIRKGCEFAMQLLFIKASFLIGTWAILFFAGDLRWMVLSLQTVVVAFAARRAKVIAIELLVWAIALLSLFYYIVAIGEPLQQGTFVWWMMVLYPLVIVLSFALLLLPFQTAIETGRPFNRAWAYAFVPLLSVALWNDLFGNTVQRGFDVALPFILLIYVAGLLSLLPGIARWMLLQLAALSFITGTIHFCDEPFSVLQLAGLVIASGVALHFILRMQDKWAMIGESALYFLTILPVTLWTLQMLDDWKGQAIIIFLLCGLISLSGWLKLVRQAGSWAFLPLLVFMLTENAAAGAGFLNIVAFATGIGWLLVPVVLPQVRSGMGYADKADAWSLIGCVLFWLYALLFGDPEASWMSGQWVLGILAILLLLGSKRWNQSGYMLAALLFAATVMGRHTLAMGIELSYLPWKTEALLSAGILYVFSLLWFFLKPDPFAKQPKPTPELISIMSSGASAILLFAISAVTFHYSELGWIKWYTPIMAMTAFSMILLGLFFRDTVFRRLGLVALVLPLARLFLVDVQDVLQRIIAFAASAVLLTLLGYLYHRLSSQLSAGSTGSKPGVEPEG